MDPKPKREEAVEWAKALATEIEKRHIAEARRNLVGGLIRWLKDGDGDLSHLLFNYVHVEDYGQAMVEGWGELHELLINPPRSATIGALGLPFIEVGEVVQAICAAIVDRGEYTKEQIIEQIYKSGFDETYWWDAQGGYVLDDFQRWIAL